MRKGLSAKDFSKPAKQLIEIAPQDLMKLPHPYDRLDAKPPFSHLTEEQRIRYESSLDGVLAVGIPKPKTKEEEKELVAKFLSGLRKLLSKESNWTFLQPLRLSLDYCLGCQTCSQACPIYISSGGQEIYRPTLRSEILRKIIRKYIKGEGKLLSKFTGSDIELNWTTIARLAELAYRCTLCRRCAQFCPIGIDNGLITREIRKLFSQELGIVPKELHELGTIRQLKVGSASGVTPKALKGIIQFMENEIEERTGKKIKIPLDKEGADILFMHNAGEFVSWPENIEAFAIIFEAAGISWTLSSDLLGYDAVNFGVFYDDVQLARIALKQVEMAKKLKVKKIVIGEIGCAHRVSMVIADRIFTGESNIPRESFLPLLEEIVCNGRLKLDPSRNNLPVTLHDPCNIVRMMGIAEPQRRILSRICPQFREMEPHGFNNYCCGGGSGFALISLANFPSWRLSISGRMKLKQILEAFQDVISPEVKKYVCAPCSTCKGQLRGLFEYYDVWNKCGILYGGLVELVVNAMADIKQPYITWPS